MKTGVLILFAVCTLCQCHAQDSKTQVWPVVSNLRATFDVTDKNPNIETTVFEEAGKPLYRIICHEGDFEDAETGSYDLLFHCKLVPVDTKDRFRDLFVPSDRWRRSRTRATFNSGLDDKCSDHPFYGQRRTFLVRGMKIKLEVAHFTFKPTEAEILEKGLIKPTQYGFSFGIDVIPDSTATGEIAGPAPQVCEDDFSLGKDGKIIEKKSLYPDPAQGIR